MRTTRAALAGLALAALLLGAALASAAVVKTGTAKVRLAPGVEGSTTARCVTPGTGGKGAKRYRLVGAGFSTASQYVSIHGLVPGRSRVDGTARNDGMAKASVKFYAYCSKAVSAKSVSVKDSFHALQTHNVFVRCGKGTVPIAGGWRAVGTPPQYWQALNSVKVGRSWLVSVAASGAGKLRVYAVCARKPLRLTIATGQKALTGPAALATSKARCPQGSVAISGGFTTAADEGTTFGAVAVPVASYRTGNRGWAASGTSETSSADDYIRASAYCLKKR